MEQHWTQSDPLLGTVCPSAMYSSCSPAWSTSNFLENTFPPKELSFFIQIFDEQYPHLQSEGPSNSCFYTFILSYLLFINRITFLISVSELYPSISESSSPTSPWTPHVHRHGFQNSSSCLNPASVRDKKTRNMYTDHNHLALTWHSWEHPTNDTTLRKDK